MSHLFSHIEYLLLRHDCVIVPGLGAFIATMSGARLDLERGEILPPSRRVMFNKSVKVDDGLLANSFARKYNITFEDARSVIERKVNALFSELNTSGRVSCGALGSLLLGDEGNIVFEPRREHADFFSNIGLNSVRFIVPDDSSDIKSGNSGNELYEDEDNSESRYYHFRINKSFLRFTAIFASVLALALAIILNPLPYDNREQRASVVPVEVLLPSVTKKMPSDSITLVSKATEKSDTTVKEVSLPEHYLIVGTFSTEKEARKYISMFEDSEYVLSPVSSRKVCRVAVAASDNKDELRTLLNSRKIKTAFPNAWIWSR